MRASAFEFRYRFFVIALIFCAGFGWQWAGSRLPTTGEIAAAAFGERSRFAIQTVFLLGALISAAAAFLRTWATAYLKGGIVHDMALHFEQLIADGPYRYVRNPLYLGLILLGVGMGVLAALPGFFILLVGLTLFSLRLIGREEAGLEQQQGPSFLEFKTAVPKLIPALRPRLPRGGMRPDWGQAWLAEAFMWMFVVAQCVFALTLQARFLVVAIGATLLLYAVLHVVHSRRQRKRLT